MHVKTNIQIHSRTRNSDIRPIIIGEHTIKITQLVPVKQIEQISLVNIKTNI